mgnify:CR=1 FL=1
MNELIINRVMHGDCLELSNEIGSGSVDLILTDLPYGIIKGVGFGGWDKEKTYWDIAIDPKMIFEIANRILRKNGKMVLFSQEPYTTELRNGAVPNISFSYRAIWEKDHFANALGVNKAMVSMYEDILIFSKKECQEAKHPLRVIMLKYVKKYGKDFIVDLFREEGRYKNQASARVHASYKFGFNSGLRFELMDKKMYEFLSHYIQFEETYDELKAIDIEYKHKYSSTFNLWEGNKFKSNILKYKKDYDGYHPTQKPVLLLEDLIKTFSNKGDTVVDLTAGSCSSAIACINTDRNFICIEKDWDYCQIANKRIEEAKANFRY